MTTDETEHIERAKHYPYAVPRGSYVFASGRELPIVAYGGDTLSVASMSVMVDQAMLTFPEYAASVAIPDAQLTASRTPVLCYGSNASKHVLARKFAHVDDEVVIPVVAGILSDFDAVFSAHISSYGSIPATLQYSPGTQLRVFILPMTDSQLDIMHVTEGPYNFGKLDQLELAFGDDVVKQTVHTYISRNGALLINDTEVALQPLEADHRRFPARTEEQMLAWLRDSLAPSQALDDFIRDHINDPDVRSMRSEWLHERSRRFGWTHWQTFSVA